MTICSGSYGCCRDDRKPLQIDETWAGLCEIWRDHSQEARHPADKDIGLVPFLSPFVLKAGAVGKTVENVERCGAWFGIDIDAAGWTLLRLQDHFDHMPHCIHSTTQSQPYHQRYRVLFALSREVRPDEHASVWQAINTYMHGTLDPSTKNVNRLLFVPARWHGAHHAFAAKLDGTPFDVDAVAQAIPLTVTTPVVALIGQPWSGSLITPCMERRFRAAAPGGRFWKLLLAMAYRAKENGWQVTVQDLEREAVAFDRSATGGGRKNTRHEAARALGVADAKGRTLTALELYRKRRGIR